jgi:hypothetical protein
VTVGLPGTGIGGLYYLLLVCWMPLRALGRLVIGRGVARWRGIAVLLALVAAILGALWVEGWGLRAAFLRVGELAPAGSELRRQVEIARYYLSPALAWVPIAVLSFVVGGAHCLRWVVRCSAWARRSPVLRPPMPVAMSGAATGAASPPTRRRA